MTETPSNSSTKIVLILVAGVLVLGFACCGGGGILVWYIVATYERFVVPQNGMYPTLPADSRFIAVRNPYADASQVKRGDVVVFSHREDGKETIYVSRIIGLPGDAIETGLHSVSINRVKLRLDKKRAEGGVNIFTETNGPAQYEVAYEENPRAAAPDTDLIVPADRFFVLGDNRHQSGKDSRTIDTIPFHSIKAKKW